MKLPCPITRSELDQLSVSLENLIEDAPDASAAGNAVSALEKFNALRSDITPDELTASKIALQYDLNIFEAAVKHGLPAKKRLKFEKCIRDIRSLLHKFLYASFE
ncbi:hypothetical protein [Agathobaculum sp.]|uniref:hypothetical protein n=1 Tax=Agathobaculum sp. TaxID=2048138 RepID=UPI0025BC8132|nr:hypothetical protein [Agathobaculum sp.]